MPTGNPVDVLLAHNRWANDNLINACRSLSEEQFHQRFDMGLGSLHDTIVHILGAMRGWTDMLAERETRPRPEGRRFGIDEITAMGREAADEFEAVVRAHDLDETATGSRGGRTYTFARGAVLTHVTTHGVHHRAQCLNMLRCLGVEKLPPSSVVEWMLIADAPAGV
ncbi:MAG: DinB family protein [Phycisphaerales bacterium]|nr:DinB family protein [Phycisphaerales bacterium]